MPLIRSPRYRVSRAALATMIALGLAETGFAPGSFAAGREAASVPSSAAAKARSRAQLQRDRRGPARVRVNRLPTYPGPYSVRQCTAWLAQEYRPSGTVVVPLMRCWWEPG